MNFSDALMNARAGKKIARTGWNGAGSTVKMVVPIADPGYAPYLIMKTATGTTFPWTPNQLDLLTDDWTVVNS